MYTKSSLWYLCTASFFMSCYAVWISPSLSSKHQIPKNVTIKNGCCAAHMERRENCTSAMHTAVSTVTNENLMKNKAILLTPQTKGCYFLKQSHPLFAIYRVVQLGLNVPFCQINKAVYCLFHNKLVSNKFFLTITQLQC